MLVHGIGEHAEGDTLLSFAEPLVDWLRDWLEGSAGGVTGKEATPRGKVDVLTARMRARRNEAESPAYARVDITAFDSRRKETWLFVESWWGDSVKIPAALELLVWMLLRAPLLVYWHFNGGARLKHALDTKSQRAVWGALLRAAVSCFVALALQVIVVVSIVLWAIPFGPWREALLNTVRKLASILGDSFVLLEQDIQRATLVQRVRSALAWLDARVEKVVVIAHSQGAAIAHAAIKASPYPTIRGHVSVGSGLEKLELLRLVRSDRKGVLSAQVLGLSTLFLALAFLQGMFSWIPNVGRFWIGAAVLSALAMIFAWVGTTGAMKYYWKRMEEQLDDAELTTASNEEIRWTDIYAGMDLVPMGSNSQLQGRRFVKQVRVTNEASLFGDHVHYFETRNDFAPRCWQILSTFSSAISFTERDEAQLDLARRWHRRRAVGLALGQWLNPMTALVSAVLVSGAVLAVGASLMKLLDDPKTAWPHRLLDWASHRLAAGLQRLLPLQPAGPEDLPNTLVGALAVLLGLVAWWMLAMSLWRASNQRLARQVARHGRFRHQGWLGSARAWIGVVVWMIVAMLPLLSVFVAYLLQDMTVGSVFRAFTLVASGLSWSCAIMFGLGAPFLGMENSGRPGKPDPVEQLIAIAMALLAPPCYGAFGWWMWRAIGEGPTIGDGWLTAAIVLWGAAIAGSAVLVRHFIDFRAGRAAAVALYLAGLVAGWFVLRDWLPAMWPLAAVVGAGGAVLLMSALAYWKESPTVGQLGSASS